MSRVYSAADRRLVTVRLTRSQVELLIEAIDSHQYWQLADSGDRNDGYVYGESRRDPEFRRCERLIERLHAALPVVSEVTAFPQEELPIEGKP